MIRNTCGLAANTMEYENHRGREKACKDGKETEIFLRGRGGAFIISYARKWC